MEDYSYILERIKQSDVQISSFTNEMKELEAEMKKVINETDIIKAKSKTLAQDIKYKEKLLAGKRCKEQALVNQYIVWADMLKEKKLMDQDYQNELEELKKKVFHTRINFNTNIELFITECDFLHTRSEDIDNAIKMRREESQLLKDISCFENEVTILEEKDLDLRKQLEQLAQMERTKQALDNEPETGTDFKRIRLRIESCEEELEDLEQITNNRIQSNPYDVPTHTRQVFYDPYERSINEGDGPDNAIEDITFAESICNNDNSNVIGSKIVHNKLISYKKEKNKKTVSFTPKMPSNLIKRNTLKRLRSDKNNQLKN